MRVGQNPAKFVNTVEQPADVTITVVTCVPFLSGYYEQGRAVLQACLNSIVENTDLPYDLMVFDNHSCMEVRQDLIEAYEQGLIQYLVLSGKNIGKMGAWNYLFGAAQGSYVAFADSDVYFRRGWLSGSLALFTTFPNVGMVTGRPLRTPMEFSSSTLEWAVKQGDVVLEEGQFLDWETYQEHVLSLGMSEDEISRTFRESRDYRLNYNGQCAYIGAAHFQFIAKREVLQQVCPIPSERPLRGDRALDIAINELKLLRLTTCEPYVFHMGNRLPDSKVSQKKVQVIQPASVRFLNIPFIRRILLKLHNWIFNLYFEHL